MRGLDGADDPLTSETPPTADKLRVFGVPLLLLCLGLLASYRAAAIDHQSMVQRLRDDTRAELEPIRGDLSRRVFAAVHLTEGIASLIAIEGEPPPPRFRALASELLGRSDTIRNVALAPDNVVSQVHPLEGNEAVLGFRYADSPVQWPSVQRMMAEDRLVVAGPVPLVQGGVGIIARRPVRVVNPRGGTRYWGFVSTVIDFPGLMARASPSKSSLRLALRGADGLGAQGKTFWGDERVFDEAPVLSEIPLPSGTWQLGGVPNGGWPAFRALGSTYFHTGSLATLALTLLFFRVFQIGSARRLEVVQRAKAEAALRKSEARLLKAQDVARLGFLDWNLRTQELYCSDEIYRMYGIVRDDAPTTPELIGRVVHPEDRAMVQQRLEEAVQGSSKYDLDHRVLRPDSSVVWVHAQAELELDENGKPVRLLGTAHDITERKRADDALRQAYDGLEAKVSDRTRELSVAKDAAESADRLKSAFLATMSHELRTPLNSILGFTGIVLKGMAGPLSPEQTKQLGMVQGSARHLLDLINDVLDISKIEAGQLKVASEAFDAGESLSRVVASIRPLADKKHLDIVTAIADDLGTVRGDRRRFEQVLLNLLSNAIKFTEEGTVTVEATCRGDRIEVSIRDTGIGIGPEEIPRLFQPFHQIENGLSRRHEGTGLGLAICRRLVSLMQGTLEVESALGVGSTFRIALPRGAGDASDRTVQGAV